MTKVLVIGGATLDTIISYENMETMVHERKHYKESYLLLGEGRKIEVTEQKYFSGGGATNTAVSFKRQGFDVSLLCKIGNDAAGRVVKEELENLGVSTELMRYSNEEGTASSFVVPSLNGDRTVFAYRGASTKLLACDLPMDEIARADFVYVSSLSKQAAKRLPDIVKQAQKYQVRVAINPGISQLQLGSSFLQSSLDGIEVLILNYEEAAQFMSSLAKVDEELQAAIDMHNMSDAGSKLLDNRINFQDTVFSLRQFFAEILKRGPKTVVVTNGIKGVYVATKDNIYFHKVKPVNVVNTLGAGDAFGSSFVAALMQGKPIESAIRSGVINSSSVVKHKDAKTGLMAAVDIEAELVKMDQSLLRTICWES